MESLQKVETIFGHISNTIKMYVFFVALREGASNLKHKSEQEYKKRKFAYGSLRYFRKRNDGYHKKCAVKILNARIFPF